MKKVLEDINVLQDSLSDIEFLLETFENVNILDATKIRLKLAYQDAKKGEDNYSEVKIKFPADFKEHLHIAINNYKEDLVNEKSFIEDELKKLIVLSAN